MDAVSISHGRKLGKGGLGRARAEIHAIGVEAAKSTVMLLPPPAATGRLNHQPGLHLSSDGRGIEGAEIVIKIRGGNLIQFESGGSLHDPALPARIGAQHARRQLRLPGQQRGTERREGEVGLTGHQVVHPAEMPMQNRAHGGVAIGAAHHGHNLRSQFANFTQQGQRRAILGEHAGATHNARLHFQDFSSRSLNKSSGSLSAGGEFLDQTGPSSEHNLGHVQVQ